MIRRCSLSLALALALGSPAYAGTYADVAARTALHPLFDPDFVQPFAIVHPIGYAGGAPGIVTVRICVRPEDPQLVPAVQMAVDMWNRLEPTTGNCLNCQLWEDPSPPPPEPPFHAFTSTIHELGHCAMGLDHPNLHETLRPTPHRAATGTCSVDEDSICGEPTSFTASGNATRILDADGVRGSADDDHQNQCRFLPMPVSARNPPPGVAAGGEFVCGVGSGGPSVCPSPPVCCPRCDGQNPECPVAPMEIASFHWYRLADDNPFAIDSTVIDRTTFSRRADLLPAGHNYSVNGNRGVADQLNLPNTQVIMYSLHQAGMHRTGLAADDVNMVKMGMTGVDRLAGTSDDYTIALVYQPTCATANIRVSLTDVYLDEGSLAECIAEIKESYPSNSLHYSMDPVLGANQLYVELNPNETWDFAVPWIFGDSFETGDMSVWGTVCPPTCGPGGEPPPPPPP